jgi:hypothetical protein
MLPVLFLLGSTPALAKSSSPRKTAPLANAHELLGSHELWATIDICNPTDQPDMVGVRGSMPGDGQAGDKMYMSFRLQYLSTSRHWIDAPGVTTAFESVGGKANAVSRQSGSSFQLVLAAGKPASQLRGVVDFQWRRGKKVVLSGVRATTAGHVSTEGADPAGFSAASCLIG